MNQLILFGGAFLTGIVGSMHCLGMCGPIAMALPVGKLNIQTKIFSISAYHFGRIFMYSILGICIGLIGKSFAIAGLQQWVSIFSGIFLILIFIPNFNIHITYVSTGMFKLKQLLSAQLSKKGIYNFLFTGFLNGLLPCGLVYVALTAALCNSDPITSAGFMLFFGFGTIPALFSIVWISSILSVQKRQIISKFSPIFAVFIGLLLITRGLNLGIPYLSPKIVSEQKMECCKK
ncbi:MAG: sulfite exporter TauE/SafE family protein [Bacteroidota bacterium]|nr:sulfite exporter TauE/SafE family protein [Bacteroidota bacterium]